MAFASTEDTGVCFRHRFLRARLPHSRLHVLRHAAAKLPSGAEGSIEEVPRFLDHSSLAVTTTYLRRLQRQEGLAWGRVTEAIGL
jgi:integrase